MNVLVVWKYVTLPGNILSWEDFYGVEEGNCSNAAKTMRAVGPGRLSHHPLLAVLAVANFVLYAWLRQRYGTRQKVTNRSTG